VNDTSWYKSSYSMSNGHCVEAAAGPHGDILVRDSKNPDGPHLTFSSTAWAAFLTEVKTGGRLITVV
jgi:Domain of unknown function (DUF397)